LSKGFEVHITGRLKDKDYLKTIAEQFGWKTSCIAGDPVLGPETHFYLTCYDLVYGKALNKLQLTATAIRDANIEVVREKIEFIVYDSRDGFHAV
jgi:hypothetical protein